MKTSRAPVQAALRILEEENLVRRFEGRGYLVGDAKSTEKPLRTDLTKLGLSDVGRDRQRLAKSRPLGARL